MHVIPLAATSDPIDFKRWTNSTLYILSHLPWARFFYNVPRARLNSKKLNRIESLAISFFFRSFDGAFLLLPSTHGSHLSTEKRYKIFHGTQEVARPRCICSGAPGPCAVTS